MADRLEIHERTPDPQANQPQPRRKMTAVEARKKYGIRSVVLAALLLWFGYDGWYNPKFQKPEKKFDMWFNKVGAYVLGVSLAYSAMMFISAARTVTRQEASGEVEQPSDNPPAA